MKFEPDFRKNREKTGFFRIFFPPTPRTALDSEVPHGLGFRGSAWADVAAALMSVLVLMLVLVLVLVLVVLVLMLSLLVCWDGACVYIATVSTLGWSRAIGPPNQQPTRCG